MFTRTITCCLTAAALLCLVGCSTVYMKATPFYTGEYGTTEEPADRGVNLWPVLYYREPVLSVLWPLAQFDFQADNHCVFPVFWWDSGFTVFPFVWHERDDHFAVFPLWLDSKSAGGRDTWVLPPIFRLKRQEDERGFHVWPLIGAYEEGDDSSYNFTMWPFCHAWREGDLEWRLVLPLYYARHEGDDSLALTPFLFSGVKGDSEWNLLFFIYYASTNRAKDEERWLTPLLGRTRSGDRIRWRLGPIVDLGRGSEKDKDI